MLSRLQFHAKAIVAAASSDACEPHVPDRKDASEEKERTEDTAASTPTPEHTWTTLLSKFGDARSKDELLLAIGALASLVAVCGSPAGDARASLLSVAQPLRQVLLAEAATRDADTCWDVEVATSFGELLRTVIESEARGGVRT